MKQIFAAFLALCITATLTACGEAGSERTEITVFAAASMQEALDAAIEGYKAVAPDVTVVATYDSSGTLKTQLQEGAPCDLFISAAPKQLDALDGSLIGDPAKNPDGLDLILQGTRIDLLENRVTLAVPEGNPAGIESFDQLPDLLKNGEILLAIGNSDVPVGQYTQKIFAYYGIDEGTVAGNLSYASNAKEVTTQVSEGTVDCGIVYGTDAFSAGLPVADEATAEMCGQVLYPAAVINSGSQTEAAQAFLAYLSSDGAKACFEAVGFSPLT
jgi:molybdate transport system substrate-binding protein